MSMANLTRHLLWCMVVLGLLGVGQVFAEVSIRVSWERPVQFRLTDAETGAAIPRPLLIIITEKFAEGGNRPIPFYDVLEGTESGVVAYQASDKDTGVEIRAVATGYALLSQKVNWQDLPPRHKDQHGLDVGAPEVIPVALKNLSHTGRWQSHFRLVIAPELEEMLQLKPPHLSPAEKRLISDFLNRQHNQRLGF